MTLFSVTGSGFLRALDREPDATAAVGELAGVVQQIADDLRQASRVGVQVHRRLRQRDRQFLTHAFAQRTDGFHGVVDDRRQFDALLAKLHLAAADAAHVEQVIDQPHHLADLPLQHVHRGIDRMVESSVVGRSS